MFDVFPLLALAVAALAVFFWRTVLRIVLILIVFFIVLGVIALMQHAGQLTPATTRPDVATGAALGLELVPEGVGGQTS